MATLKMKQRIPSPVKPSEFPQAEMMESDRPGQFGTAQLQDPNSEQAWRSIKNVDNQLLEKVSELTYPHFVVKNTLL